MPKDTLDVVEGPERERLITTAKNRPEYQNLHEYFTESRSLTETDIGIYETEEGLHVVNFNYESSDAQTLATIAFILKNGSILESNASIDYYSGDSIASVDVCEFDEGTITCQNVT